MSPKWMKRLKVNAAVKVFFFGTDFENKIKISTLEKLLPHWIQ